MAHKTFIAYKYSEARTLRDKIIKALGDDAQYYQGETSASPNLTDTTTENIKRNLTNMIYGTTVTIVIISPHMTDSKWIDWEIEYSLKETTRKDRTSRTNGIVGVIMKYNGGYDWIESTTRHTDGCTPRTIDNSKLYEIINENRFNLNKKVYVCDRCQTKDILSGSYISIINEDDFLEDSQKYIDNAFNKSERISDFTIVKTQ